MTQRFPKFGLIKLFKKAYKSVILYKALSDKIGDQTLMLDTYFR